MFRRIATAAIALTFLSSVSAQEKPDLAKVVADLKQSLAENQAQLRSYSWTETTEISLKDEVKKRDQAECRYDATGKVQKTPIGAPAEPKKQPRGLKGKVVANKVEDLKDYMDRAGSLIRRYVPPDPETIKSNFEAGKATLSTTPGSNIVALVLRDYAKNGDEVTIQVNLATKKILSFKVASYLDAPGDVVSLNVSYASLADGVSYVDQSVLIASAKEVQVKTTNFGFRK